MNTLTQIFLAYTVHSLSEQHLGQGFEYSLTQMYTLTQIRKLVNTHTCRPMHVIFPIQDIRFGKKD